MAALARALGTVAVILALTAVAVPVIAVVAIYRGVGSGILVPTTVVLLGAATALAGSVAGTIGLIVRRSAMPAVTIIGAVMSAAVLVAFVIAFVIVAVLGG